jgi:hypothetical protein
MDFEARLSFTKYNERYRVEKPYAFKIPLEGADIPSSNIDHSGSGIFHVTDIRGIESSFSLTKNGFAILPIRDDLSYEDYHDETKVQKYFKEVEELLKEHLKAKEVKVFRHAVRNYVEKCLSKLNGLFRFENETPLGLIGMRVRCTSLISRRQSLISASTSEDLCTSPSSDKHRLYTARGISGGAKASQQRFQRAFEEESPVDKVGSIRNVLLY